MTNFVECKSVPCMLPTSVAREIDSLYKTLPVGCEYHRKAIIPDAVSFEPHERAEVSILTTDSRDLADEVVLPQGLDMDHYRRTKVVLYNHHPDMVIGRNTWIKLLKDNTIRAKTVYDEHPDGDLWPISHVWTLINKGLLRAKSIGFLALEPKRDPTREELARRPEWKGAGVWSKTLLLEYSLVPSGCCPDAMLEYINSKSLDASKLTDLDIDVPVKLVVPVTKTMKPVKRKPKLDMNIILAKALEQLDVAALVAQELDKQRRNPWAV